MSYSLLDDLNGLLAAYKPYDELESAHLDQLRPFIAAGDMNPFSRGNPIGQVTASAFVVDRSATRTLLAHHAKLDRWLQFGGHIEAAADLTIAGAALREASEESGIDGLRLADPAIFDIDVHPIPETPRKTEPPHLHFDIRFLLIAPTDAFTVSEESNDLRWCTLDEAMLLLGYDAGLVRMLKKWQQRQAALNPIA